MAVPRFGLGLSIQPPQTTIPPEAVLSTAPASPTEELPPFKSAMAHPVEEMSTTISYDMPPPDSTVGSLSFGPVTQQTVTTVTRTTTYTVPPLLMRPPRDLQERDSKQYPLAFTPTPHSLKSLSFEYAGQPVAFHESEDPDETVRKYQNMQRKISENNGVIRKEEKRRDYETPTRGHGEPQLSRQVLGIRASSAPNRNAAPPSIAEAAEIASLQRKSKKPRSQLHRTQSELTELPSLNQRTADGAFTATSHAMPVTPDTEAGDVGQLPPRASIRRLEDSAKNAAKPSWPRLRGEQHPDLSRHHATTDAADEEDPQHLAALSHLRAMKKKRTHDEDHAIAGASQSATTVPTAADMDSSSAYPDDERRRPILPSILTSSQLDASLPSPSLSPITAAANAASRNNNAFDASFAAANEDRSSSLSGMDLDDDSTTQSTASFNSQSSVKVPSVPPFRFTHGSQHPPTQPTQSLTLMDIPTMVEAFDTMPEAMQTYLMYQFLRRCAKPTLQMVAGVVNPALKCDPFNILPAELGLNITRFLDAKSMCRAAQVSRRWRKLINSDERAWKDLLERDAYVLPEGEIARAVKEGWGWQHPGEDGGEEDLSYHLARTTPEPVLATDAQATVISDDEETASSAVTSKTKRKSTSRHVSSKKPKRQTSRIAAPKLPESIAPWKRMLASAQGPIGYATAAATAIPHPSVGLPSLKNMHLFKSLYQRHHLIRKAWMQEDSQPQHLAFRAHHRHVVTCLLFDDDKILTGSDDTRINVYDTKTGILKKRLEGHEGGVWALQYDGDTLVSGSTDRSVRVWNIESGRCLQVFQGHTSTVRCLVILQPVKIGLEQDGTPIMMPKEPLIITGSRDSTLRVWKLPRLGDREVHHAGPPANDQDNPYWLRTLTGHLNSVRAIAAHGDTLVSGSYDCTVRVWKISNGELLHRLQGHTQKVYSVVLDHARNRCISGSMDNLVKVWDLTTGASLFNLEGHTSLVGLLDLSNDHLVSAAADSTLRIWNPQTGVCKHTLSAHTGAITCFQHDGQKVISGSDRTLKMWNVQTGNCVRDLLTDLSGVWQVRFDERRCVAAVQRNNLTYIEVSAAISRGPQDVLTDFIGTGLWCVTRWRSA